MAAGRFTNSEQIAMAYITKFSISGLAGREGDYAQSLNRNVNVFFGSNGSGKTSLLRILDSSMTGDAASLVSVPFVAAEVAIYSDQYQREFVRRLQKENLVAAAKKVGESPQPGGKPRAVLAWEERTPMPEATRRPLSWQHLFLPLSRLYAFPRPRQQYYGYQAESLSEEALNAEFSNAIIATWTQYNAQLNAQVRAIQSEGLTNILRAVFNPANETEASRSVDPQVAYSRISAFLHRQGAHKILPSKRSFEARYQDEMLMRLIVADVDTVEQRIAAATKPSLELQSIVSNMFSGGKVVEFDDQSVKVRTKSGEELQVGDLSSGEKQILRLLIEVLRATESTLLVDEPELSMHVDWQRSLVATMRSLNPRAQLILATHSPEIMAELDDAVIYRL